MTIALTEHQAQIALERAAYTGEPTARMKKAAALLSGKASDFKKPEALAEFKAGHVVAAAMLESGYGRRFVEGNAKSFPAVLVNAGLLGEAEAETVTPAPAPAAPVKTTKERETIR